MPEHESLSGFNIESHVHIALQTIWDYMLLHHKLERADAIVVLGSFDTNVGVYAAQLFLDGWADVLVCAGSGTVNHKEAAFKDFVGSTEAEVFSDIAIRMGVPKDAIIIENKSQNTGQNYEFTTSLLLKRNIDVRDEKTKIIAVQKQFMERRTFATGKVWWPNVNLIVTSPPMQMKDYPSSNPSILAAGDHWMHAMVGDLQRIIEYPKKGFQIEQLVPDQVREALQVLVQAGYTKCLLR